MACSTVAWQCALWKLPMEVFSGSAKRKVVLTAAPKVALGTDSRVPRQAPANRLRIVFCRRLKPEMTYLPDCHPACADMLALLQALGQLWPKPINVQGAVTPPEWSGLGRLRCADTGRQLRNGCSSVGARNNFRNMSHVHFGGKTYGSIGVFRGIWKRELLVPERLLLIPPIRLSVVPHPPRS